MTVAEVVPVPPDLVDAPTLLLIGVCSGIEDNAVPRLEGSLRLKGHKIGSDFSNPADEGATLLTEPCVHEFAVVHPVHPSGIKAA